MNQWSKCIGYKEQLWKRHEFFLWLNADVGFIAAEFRIRSLFPVDPDPWIRNPELLIRIPVGQWMTAPDPDPTWIFFGH